MNMNMTRRACKTTSITGALAFSILTLTGCGKSDTAPIPSPVPATAASSPTAAPAENMPTNTGAHGDPGAPKSTPNGTGGTTEATGDNISTGSAGGVPNAGAANADNAAKPESKTSSPQ
jgi:hypothetical protein